MRNRHFSAVPPHGGRGSIRLTFAYRGDDIQLVRAEPVRKVAPGQTGLAPPPEDALGYWFELRGPDGDLLYHRVLHDPVPRHQEVFEPDGRSISRRPVERPEGEFSLLAPDIPGAAEFVFRAAPLGEGKREVRRRALRFQMDGLRAGRTEERDSDSPYTAE